MGILNFSKLFAGDGEVKLTKYKGKRVAIDASTEIYRSIYGMKSITGLTDPSGNPTLHLSTILNNIILFKKIGIKTIWVFDNSTVTNLKELEV